MVWLYIIAFVPCLIGLGLYLYSHSVHIAEWAIGSVVAFIMAGTAHLIIFNADLMDRETWSGQIITVRQYSAWQEYYEYAVYRTEVRHGTRSVSDGKGGSRTESYTYTVEVFDHWEPTSRWHKEHWVAFSNIDTQYPISKHDYALMANAFGGDHAEPGDRKTFEHNSRMMGGDPNDWVANNRTGVIFPVTKSVLFANRLKKNSGTLYDMAEVPKDLVPELFVYPKNENPWKSERLLGKAAEKISILKWDQMNARLGPTKQVNLVLVDFADKDSSYAEYQRALWRGGKKNDLILMVGDSWSRVYGWTEEEMVKRSIEEILINNPLNDEIIPLIEEQVRLHYKLVPWKKFDYIPTQPTALHIIIYLIFVTATQIGIYLYFHNNEMDKQ